MKNQERREKDELKKIFDELRSIGGAKDFSLSDALDKAIRREKDSLAKMSKMRGENLFFGKLRHGRLSQLPIQITVVLILTWAITFLIHFLPAKVQASDETTTQFSIRANSKLLRVENRN